MLSNVSLTICEAPHSSLSKIDFGSTASKSDSVDAVIVPGTLVCCLGTTPHVEALLDVLPTATVVGLRPW